jgi:hypothetical protein
MRGRWWNLHDDGGSTSAPVSHELCQHDTTKREIAHQRQRCSWRAQEGERGVERNSPIVQFLHALCRKRFSLAKLASRFQVVGLNLLIVGFFKINLLGRGGGDFCLPVLLYIYILVWARA